MPLGHIKSKNTKLHTDFFAIYISYLLVANFICNTFFGRISSPLCLSSYHHCLLSFQMSIHALIAIFFYEFPIINSFPKSFSFWNRGGVVKSGLCWFACCYGKVESIESKPSTGKTLTDFLPIYTLKR